MSDYIHPDSIEYKLNLGRVPPEPQEGIIWRGMSGGEYKNLLEQGFLESKGDYNIGESQKGLTIFSSNPRTAEMYAHDFAPREFKATPESSAYVVGIRKPSGAIPQTQINPSEFGVRGQIPIEDIVSVYRGNVFRPRSDRQRAVLDWQEMSLPERRLPQDEPRSTNLVEQRPGLPRLTGVGQVFRGIGSMIGGPKLRAVRKLITMAQQGYELLPKEQKLLGDVLDMEALTKQIPGTGRGLEYFRQLVRKSPKPEPPTPLYNQVRYSEDTNVVRDLLNHADEDNFALLTLQEQFNPEATISDLHSVRQQMYENTQKALEHLPDEITVYRYGRTHGDEVASFSTNPEYRGVSRAEKRDRIAYTVNKKDILAAPDAILPKDQYRFPGEDEVIIRGDKVTPQQGGITSLPMDEASRMARAGEQNFDIDSYHGTRDDFMIFEKGDLGYHFGTPEQAWKRLVDTRKTADWEPHNAEENIMPVRLRLKNPLELPDVGSWQLPEVIARRALETKWGKSHSNELNEIMDEAAELSPTFADLDDWADSPEASELMDELRDMIKKDGYDGIKYRNIVESKYGKEGGGLTVEGHKQYEALNKEWHELRRAIFIRNEQAKRPLPHPSEATPEKVQEWLNRGLDTTPQERARLEQIAKLKELVRKNESYDPHSYIVFDSKNIRSRFAEFDPAQSESPEISKAAGGFVDKPLYDRA